MKARKFTFKVLPFLAALFITTLLSAQEVTVSGTVTDANSGEPLIGASVVVQGTTTGTITDLSGGYSISTEKGAILLFSSVGYQTTNVTVGDETTIDVALGASLEELEEVIVIGYGSIRKMDATGSVASVKTDDFNKGFQVSPSSLLEGKAAGVIVTTSSGDPGANAKISIRGNSSVRAGNDPLIVVDGVPLAGGTTIGEVDYGAGNIGASSSRNPLNFINPSDIASMDILKDASATAIYGSRGANGVILITTKSGAAGANKVNYSGSVSVGMIANKLKLYNAQEFADLVPAQDQGGDVDALDAILRTAVSHNQYLSFSGGNPDLRYRLSLGYQDQQGIIKESGLQKLTANLNVSQELLNDRLTISANMITSQVSDSYAPISRNAGFEGSLIGSALVWNPTRDFHLADGSFDQFSLSDSNPLAMLEYIDDYAKTLRFLSNISANLEIVKGLDYKFTLGLDRSSAVRSTEISSELFRPDVDGRGWARVATQNGTNLLLEHTLTYNTIIADQHRITALAGYSYQNIDRFGTSISGQDFAYDYIPYVNQLQAASQNTRDISSYKDPSTELQSFFGRVNISLFDKILATATGRADGSSKFGVNNKYGVFPSFALAYRLSEEDFIPDAFDDLKLRLGWGQTGNQEFPAGSAQAQYEVTRDGLKRSTYDNPDLKWETTTTLNAGIDFTIMDRKLSGTVEYFNKNTKDLLFAAEAALPGPSGIRRWTNLDANVLNSGVELSLNWKVVDNNDFSLDFGGNVSFIKNVLENFSGVVETGELHGQGMSGTTVQRFISGYPLHVFYTLDFLGLDDDGLGMYSTTKQYFGDPNPKTILGFNLSLRVKSFDVVANFNGAFGHYIYNNTGTSVLVASNPNKGRNTSPDYTLSGENPDNAIKGSSRYLEKGDYLRFNNLTIGYNVEKAPWFFSAIRVYLTGQNLFVLTKFTGFDPEVNVDKVHDDVPSLGIEYTPYPSARTFTFGLNLSF